MGDEKEDHIRDELNALAVEIGGTVVSGAVSVPAHIIEHDDVEEYLASQIEALWPDRGESQAYVLGSDGRAKAVTEPRLSAEATAKLKATLERAGVEFTKGKNPGVRMRG
jgi:hypothetical protein